MVPQAAIERVLLQKCVKKPNVFSDYSRNVHTDPEDIFHNHGSFEWNGDENTSFHLLNHTVGEYAQNPCITRVYRVSPMAEIAIQDEANDTADICTLINNLRVLGDPNVVHVRPHTLNASYIILSEWRREHKPLGSRDVSTEINITSRSRNALPELRPTIPRIQARQCWGLLGDANSPRPHRPGTLHDYGSS